MFVWNPVIPVSYTHLPASVGGVAGGHKAASPELVNCYNAGTVEAVSYTHLDVYKRQSYGRHFLRSAVHFHKFASHRGASDVCCTAEFLALMNCKVSVARCV